MIHAFADDTRHDVAIVAAAAIFREEQVAEAERILGQLKEAAGLPRGARLHCKVMFMGDARRGTAWESLKPEAIFELVRDVCTQVKAVSEQPLVSLVDPRRVPPRAMVPSGPIRPLGPQQIATMAYMGLWGGLGRRYPVDGFRMWIDPDPTKIQWGMARRRADATRGIYFDLGPETEPPKLEPEITPPDQKAMLLELADVYAYTKAQLVTGRQGWLGQWFTELYRLIEPKESVMEPSNDVKWVDTRKASE